MQYLTLSKIEFTKILKEVSKNAAMNALIDVGLVNPIIWRSEAIRLYGEKLLNRLEKYNLIHRKQHYPKGNYYYDVKELNGALVSENRERFYLDENTIG